MAHSLKLNKAYFVAGIGTDVGKSFLVENLCRILRKKNISVNAIKPIASGFVDYSSSEERPIDSISPSPPCHPRAAGIQEGSSQERSSLLAPFPGSPLREDDKGGNMSHDSDTARILRALGQEITPENINKITPWHFHDPVSPHLAAQAANREINFSELVTFCKKNITEAQTNSQTLLIESAGGIMTPITPCKTFLDLAFELEIPVLLLSANYLGSISHTLCAAKVLQDAKITIEKIIVNDDLFQPHTTKTADVINTIATLTKTATISLNDFLKLINEQHYHQS